jgi:hypothetical protein
MRERWVLSDWDTGAATRWKSVPPAIRRLDLSA